MEPLAVSLKEAAKMVGVSTFTIRRHIRKGALKVAHIGRRVVVQSRAYGRYSISSRRQPVAPCHKRRRWNMSRRTDVKVWVSIGIAAHSLCAAN